MSDERKGLPSASNAKRFLNCAGSFRAESGFPDTSNPASEAGTRIHDVLAGEAPWTTLNDAEREMAETLNTESDLVVANWESEKPLVTREKRLFLVEQGKELASGKGDLMAISASGKRGIIIDYKTGRGEVDKAGKNLQLRFLAVLMAQEHPNLEEITVGIIQIGSPTTLCAYSKSDIRLSRENILTGLKALDQDNAPRKSGTWCKYCKAIGVCETAIGESMQIVPQESKFELGMPFEELLIRAEIVEQIIESIKEKAKTLLRANPEAIKGYKLSSPIQRRAIKSPETAFTKLSTILNGSEFASCCSVKVGDLQKLLAKKQQLGVKDSKEALSNLLGDELEVIESEPRLMKK